MRIKTIPHGHQPVFCPYCRDEDFIRVQAAYRVSGGRNKVSCAYHKSRLQEMVDAHERVNSRELTEADYQTWHRV